VGEPALYSCSFYCRIASIALISAFLGACSTAGGLDTIAVDIAAAKASPETNSASADEQETASIDASGETDDDEVALPVNAYAGQKLPPALASTTFEESGAPAKVAPKSPELDALIAHYAGHYEVPETLVRRVVKRESNFDPTARNKIYWGLMQIRHDTAQTMGYRGPASGLLDAETNLKYAVKYLRGAYLTADRNEDRAVSLYARGYYYDAKRKGLLKVTGLRP
jgi:soluble lytic murein transglycosylase-like protein